MKKHYFSAYSGLPGSVYFLFAARLVNSMGHFVMPLLTLILTQKLGLDKADAGSTVALLTLTQAPCVLLGGRLSDTIGRKKTLVMGNLIGAVFYLACGLGLTGKAMVGCLILAADFVAISVPASDALLADLTKPEERQSAYSLLYLGVNIGMAASPIVGGLLFRDHLPLLFLLDAATSLASVAIISARVPELPASPEASEKKDRVSLGAVLRQTPTLAVFVLLMFFYDFCYSQWNFMLPAQFGDKFAGDGARLYSVLSSVNAATVIVVTPLATRLTHLLHPLRAMALAGLFFLASYAGFCAGGDYPVYFVFAVLFTLGEICSSIQISAFLSNRSPAGCLGRLTAFSTLVRGAASALGPLLMGRMLSVWSYSSAWLATGIVVLAASAGFFLLEKKDGQTESP